jgi:hypothetical protein
MCSCREPAPPQRGVRAGMRFCIPIAIGTGRWLKIWFQDNVSMSSAKTMTARASAGSPTESSGLVKCYPKLTTLPREAIVMRQRIYFNVSAQREGNYIYRLLAHVDYCF